MHATLLILVKILKRCFLKPRDLPNEGAVTRSKFEPGNYTFLFHTQPWVGYFFLRFSSWWGFFFLKFRILSSLFSNQISLPSFSDQNFLSRKFLFIFLFSQFRFCFLILFSLDCASKHFSFFFKTFKTKKYYYKVYSVKPNNENKEKLRLRYFVISFTSQKLANYLYFKLANWRNFSFAFL